MEGDGRIPGGKVETEQRAAVGDDDEDSDGERGESETSP